MNVHDVPNLRGGDPVGELHGGRARLQGPLVHRSLWDESISNENDKNTDSVQAGLDSRGSPSILEWDDIAVAEEYPGGSPVHLLLLKTQHIDGQPAECSAILLRLRGHQRGQFPRAGLILHGEVKHLDDVRSRGKNSSLAGRRAVCRSRSKGFSYPDDVNHKFQATFLDCRRNQLSASYSLLLIGCDSGSFHMVSGHVGMFLAAAFLRRQLCIYKEIFHDNVRR
ncbi:unnamed protein product [Diplocarpon coronariae]|uniref:Uncharacterized protein n=1 Tax=Diplocarpon coronariae TaxID=2795749 RepID=A0A218Z2L1_9HELO|nr:hypothetical protein B2J93_7027 [Marssonina coronariae]